MYYQHTDTRSYRGSYDQQDVNNGRMLLQPHAACFCDSELRVVSDSSCTNDFHNPVHVHAQHAQQRDCSVVPSLPSYHLGGGTPAPESRMASCRHDVTQRTSGIPVMMSRPSPYDCKPPYSYISLIAMAIESSPGRRSVSLSDIILL